MRAALALAVGGGNSFSRPRVRHLVCAELMDHWSEHELELFIERLKGLDFMVAVGPKPRRQDVIEAIISTSEYAPGRRGSGPCSSSDVSENPGDTLTAGATSRPMPENAVLDTSWTNMTRCRQLATFSALSCFKAALVTWRQSVPLLLPIRSCPSTATQSANQTNVGALSRMWPRAKWKAARLSPAGTYSTTIGRNTQVAFEQRIA